MPDELFIENGKAAMMYVGETPWHRLGKKLDKPATAAEAIKAARLDWEVVKIPLYVKGRRRYRLVPATYATVRTDRPEPAPLGIVGEDYEPLQNRDAFAWFDGIVGEGAAIYHTAGVLGIGERVWILAKLPGEIRVKGEDIVNKFLLLSNSHDGESSVQVKFTPIRVVCQNTLTMALSSGRTVKISHTRSIMERMETAKQNLGIIQDRFQRIEKAFQRFAEVPMTGNRLTDYLVAVFPMPQDENDQRAKKRVEIARQECGRLLEVGLGNDAAAIRGTLWAAYNGVTQFVDYRATRGDESQRLESIWFASGYLMKARAFRIAVERAAEWN